MSMPTFHGERGCVIFVLVFQVSDRQKRVSSAIKTELVQAFFNGYPGFDEQTWLGPMFWPRSRSQSSISSQGSSGRSSPVLPEEDKDKCSNIRGDESVKRVAEAVFQIKRRTERPFCILQNKQFQTLQEDVNKGLLCVSKKKADEEELDRGDFDVIILHSVHGYIYIEVKVLCTLMLFRSSLYRPSYHSFLHQ